MSWLKPRLAASLLAAAVTARLCASVAPESGAFVFQNYLAEVYGASVQNWDIVQDSRGVVYVANTDGVLEFDGSFWRLIPLTKRSEARCLAKDANGKIYVGGQHVFGYLAPDEHGFTRFIPLAIPPGEADFDYITNIVATAGGVYFGSPARIFFLSNNGKVSSIRPTAKFGRIFAAYGELFATTTDSGLLRLERDEFRPGPTGGDKDLTHGRVIYAPGELPLLASGVKLFLFTLSAIEPFPNEAGAYFEEHKIRSLAQLPGGEIAVGTVSGGLVVLSHDGKLKRKVRSENGLISDRINAIFQDNQKAVWLATDNGLARFSPALSKFAEAQGLQGKVTAVSRLDGTLYAGTTRGLFRMRTSPGGSPSFELVGGLEIPEQIWAIQQQHGDAFISGDHGMYRFSAGKIEKLAGPGLTVDFHFSRQDDSVLYSAGEGGVRKWKEIGDKWTLAAQGESGQSLRSVVEDSDGKVWATERSAVRRFDLDAQPVKVETFDAKNGVPENWITPYWFHGHVIFATAKGLRRFSESSRKFVPDPELGVPYSDGRKGVAVVREDSDGNVWVSGTLTGGAGYQDRLNLQRDGEYSVYPSPLLQSGIGEIWSLRIDDDGTVWASGSSGELYRREKLPAAADKYPLPVLLRSVTVIGQKREPLFGGDVDLASPDRLEYRDNALRFEFASPFFEAPSAMQYRFQLEGNEKNVSAWTSDARKDYTNLFEGSYVFRVRARDPRGRETAEAAYPFQVVAPFYRSFWAYALYVAAFLFAGWLILRWRLRALKAKNRWLEGVVLERTAEVRKERDQNETLLLNILPRPVAAELRTNGAVKPTTFDDVTVCFSDFVGFTLSSEKMPAEKLITSLNEYFTAFDDIIGRYGLEKLKTIGDAYMFAGGMPSIRPSHAVDSVLAALEMAAAVNRLTRPDEGVNWQIRLGLYSGPVVAGVVGVRKFAFDIWGSTVNFAARMESAGSPGRINLSETTYRQVAPFIECESRGGVLIKKEDRRMEMYFALGPKAELSGGPLINGVPEAFRMAYEEAFGETPRSFPAPAVLEELSRPPLVAPGEIK